MKSLRIAAIFAFCIAPVSTFAAESYRSELTLAGSSFRDDAQTKSTQAQAAVSLYFAALPVNPDYPLAEVPFVERAGGIELAYSRGNYEDPFFERTDRVAENSAAIRLSHKEMPLTAFFGLRKVDFGQLSFRDGFGQIEIETKTSEVELGYFVQERLRVSVARELATTSYAFVPSFTSIPDFEVETRSVAGHHLGESDGGHFSLSGYAASIRKDEGRVRNRELAFGGRNYLDKNQHVGLRLGLNVGDDRADEGKWVRLSYGNFLTPRFEIFGSYEKFFAADRFAGADYDAWTAGVSLRF